MSDEVNAYEKLHHKLYERCQQLQDENERLVYRTNHIKKLTNGYIRDVGILKRRLARYNDNWQSVPIVLPHPKRKTEQKRGPKPKTQLNTPVQATESTPPNIEKKVRKPRARKVDKETLARQQQEAALLRQQQLEKRQQRQRELQQIKLKQKQERQMQKQLKQLLQQKLKQQKQQLKLHKLEQQQQKKLQFISAPTIIHPQNIISTATPTSTAAAAAITKKLSSPVTTQIITQNPATTTKRSTIQILPTCLVAKPVAPMLHVASKVSTTFLTPQRQPKPTNIGDMKMPPPPPPPKIEHFTENQAHMLLMHKPLQIIPKQRLPKQTLR